MPSSDPMRYIPDLPEGWEWQAGEEPREVEPSNDFRSASATAVRISDGIGAGIGVVTGTDFMSMSNLLHAYIAGLQELGGEVTRTGFMGDESYEIAITLLGIPFWYIFWRRGVVMGQTVSNDKEAAYLWAGLMDALMPRLTWKSLAIIASIVGAGLVLLKVT